MEVSDVFSNKVMDLDVVTLPPVFKLLTVGIAPLLSRSDVSDWGVEPDVPKISWSVGNLETKVRRWPRNIPVSKFFRAFFAGRITQKVASQIVGHFRL